MDQNRPDVNATNSQQNVHLHMHHVCACQGIFPAATATTYYPPLSYRTPIIPYATTPQAAALARPYLQHYQYTQFNVGGQYNMSAVSPLAGAYAAPGQAAAADSIALPREPRLDADNVPESDRSPPEAPAEFDYGAPVGPPGPPIIPPIADLFLLGIPWATKDFIYAFVRLTNCWHILKGYWENREGSALGKIEKELTPGFKACYVRWEKETVELATELTRIFYNLDVNQSNPGPPAGLHAPPPVLLKTHQHQQTEAQAPKGVRGILHLPAEPPAPPLTVDVANQTSSADCTRSGHSDGEGVVYMKPGSYRVPKKYKKNRLTSPRGIQFLDTAQNVDKGLGLVHENYWVQASAGVDAGEKAYNEKYMRTGDKDESNSVVEEVQQPEDLNSEVCFNVFEWLSNSNFSDCGDQQSSKSNSPPKFVQEVGGGVEGGTGEEGEEEGLEFDQGVIYYKMPKTKGQQMVITTCRRKSETLSMVYEMKNGGLTKKALGLWEQFLLELKANECAVLFCDGVVNELDLETIAKNLIKGGYRYVNEIVRDLRLLINSANLQFEKCENGCEKVREFCRKIDNYLAEFFPNYDFSFIVGKKGEKVGKLKPKVCIFDGEGDYVKTS